MTLRTILPLMSVSFTLTLYASNSGVLLALAEVESGARGQKQQSADTLVGKDGEISRYQILPSVWIAYSTTPINIRDAINPAKSSKVAEQIIFDRITKFQTIRGRAPTPLEVYILWNRPAEAYNGRISPRTRVRARRFENIYYTILAEQTNNNNNKKDK